MRISVSKIYIFGLIIIFDVLNLMGQGVLESSVEIKLSKDTRRNYLDSVQKNIPFSFLYTSAIEPEKEVEISPETYKLKRLLDLLFEDRNLQYLVRDSLIILSPKNANNDDNRIPDSNLLITGKVINRKEDPVAFASVYIKSSSRGTITNEEGEFKLHIPDISVIDTLLISCLGYQTAVITSKLLLEEDLIVKLNYTTFKIKDVIVRAKIPDDIVTKSYNARERNYSSDSRLLTAFFRETARQDEDYTSLTEALIEVYKSSYTSSAEDLVRIIKGRNGTNVSEAELVNLVVEGGLYNGLRLDIAKYGSYFYGADAMEMCEFKFVKSIIFNERQTFMVDFKMNHSFEYLGYNGTLYIDTESLALVRAEFHLNNNGLNYAKNVLVKKSPRGYKTTPKEVKYEVEYRYYNGIWNLNYVHSYLKFGVNKSRGKESKGFNSDFYTTSSFVVTGQVKQSERNFSYRESAKQNDVLVEQVKNTDSFFWENDNIILPEEPLLQTIKRLQEKGVVDSVLSE